MSIRSMLRDLYAGYAGKPELRSARARGHGYVLRPRPEHHYYEAMMTPEIRRGIDLGRDLSVPISSIAEERQLATQELERLLDRYKETKETLQRVPDCDDTIEAIADIVFDVRAAKRKIRIAEVALEVARTERFPEE